MSLLKSSLSVATLLLLSTQAFANGSSRPIDPAQLKTAEGEYSLKDGDAECPKKMRLVVNLSSADKDAALDTVAVIGLTPKGEVTMQAYKDIGKKAYVLDDGRGTGQSWIDGTKLRSYETYSAGPLSSITYGESKSSLEVSQDEKSKKLTVDFRGTNTGYFLFIPGHSIDKCSYGQ